MYHLQRDDGNRRMSEQSAPAKVHTEHEAANAAIESLRETAATLKTIGDELVELDEVRKHNEELQSQVGSLEENIAGLTDFGVVHEAWEDALEDFRRDLIDRDELLERTVGRT